MIVSPDELEHGIRVATLGSKGQPMPGIRSSPQPFCDSRNRLWSVRLEFHENAINAECGVRTLVNIISSTPRVFVSGCG